MDARNEWSEEQQLDRVAELLTALDARLDRLAELLAEAELEPQLHLRAEAGLEVEQ